MPVGSGGFGGQESIALPKTKAAHLPGWAQAALGRLRVPPTVLNPSVTTLPNGITLIVQPENVSDTVTVYGHIKNRAELQVPEGKEGLSDVVAQLFSYGSQRLDRLALQRALDAIGASAQAGTDFSLQTLSGSFARGVELLADPSRFPALAAVIALLARRPHAAT